MRRNYNLQVLAVCRGDTIIQGEELNKIVLHAGDNLCMFSTWEALYDFQKNPDFFVAINPVFLKPSSDAQGYLTIDASVV